MQEVAVILALLFLVTILSLWTRQWTVPYPTIMVIAGLVIALTPNLPAVQLTPDIVFFIFLPPLLYSAAWQTNWKEFRQNIRPISLLALGLVLVTTVVVAIVAKFLVPEMPWAAAFALGAIISPPDAIAATSLTKSLSIPRRIVVILEGESLVNDAAGLVAYRVAVATAMGSMFSLSESMAMFCYAALGGIAIGAIGAWIIIKLLKPIDDPVIETILSLLIPYVVYLPSAYFHVSEILAVVTTGLIASHYSEGFMSSESRLHATSVWQCVLFVLNGLTFIFIGLGLRQIVNALGDAPLTRTVSVAAIVLLVTIIVRIVWIFPAAYLPRMFSSTLRVRDPYPRHSHLLLISWTGMRGVVSLAAALALPIAFPFRDLILFIVFSVILGTLVLQGLTLPWLIHRLKISENYSEKIQREIDARLSILAAANSHLQSNLDSSNDTEHDIDYLKAHLEVQANRLIDKLRLQLDGIEHSAISRLPMCQSLYVGAIASQRKRLRELLDSQVIDDEIYDKLQREIDLEESRLKSTSHIDSHDIHSTKQPSELAAEN